MRLREEASSIAVGSSSDHHGSRNQAVSCTHHTSRLRMMGGHTAQTTMLRQPSAALLQCEHKHGGPYSSESFSGRGSALRVLADNASVGEPMSGSPDVTPSRQKNSIQYYACAPFHRSEKGRTLATSDDTPPRFLRRSQESFYRPNSSSEVVTPNSSSLIRAV